MKGHEAHAVGDGSLHQRTAGGEGLFRQQVEAVLPAGFLQVQRVDRGIAEIEQAFAI